VRAGGVKLGFDVREPASCMAVHQRAHRRPLPRARARQLFRLSRRLGISERLLRWDLPLPGAARAYAERLIPDARPTLVINPCSSHALRNWRPTRYAALAQHAAGRLQMRVILAGGPSELERRTGAENRAGLRQRAR